MLDKLLDILKLSGLLDSLKGYIDTKIRVYVLRLENKISTVMAGMVMLVAFITTAFICLIFLGVGLSMWLNSYLGNHYAGFFITGGVFFILMLWFAVNISSGGMHDRVKNVVKDLLNRDEEE
jgi:hypothetical protein